MRNPLSRWSRERRDLERELQGHVDEHIEALVAAGQTRADATTQARRAFGSRALVLDRCNDVWSGPLAELRSNCAFALRMFARTPGFTASCILTIALGIAANIAVSGAIDNVFVRKLDIASPDTLVRFRHIGANTAARSVSDYELSAMGPGGLRYEATFSYPMFQTLAAKATTVSDLFACAPYGNVNVVVDGQAELATAFLSTGNYYQALGVSAQLGRVIVPGDDSPAAEPVAVISDCYWRSRFGADPRIVGRTMIVSNVPLTIVGVLPKGFRGVQSTRAELPAIGLPLALDPRLGLDGERLREPTTWWLQVMGRVRDGHQAAQVQAELQPLFAAESRAAIENYLSTASEPRRALIGDRRDIPNLAVDSGARGIYSLRDEDRRALAVLAAVAIVVLVLVCANVANLLLSRAVAREGEFDVRVSLGAGRARLIRQLLVESGLLAIAGSALGFALGVWVQRRLPGTIGYPARVDATMIATAVAITSFIALAFGAAPALQASRHAVNGAGASTAPYDDRIGTFLVRPADHTGQPLDDPDRQRRAAAAYGRESA
jgi:predicted permease